jgi:hypothetical protein
METTQAPASTRPRGWAGIVFAVLYVVGIIMVSSSPEHTDDKPFKDNPTKLAALWRAYYNDSGHRRTIVIGAFVIIAAAIAFVIFGNDLRERLAAYGARTTGGLALAGTIIFATVTAVGAIALAWIPGSKTFGDSPVPTGELNYLASQLGYGIMLLPGGAAAALTLVSGGLGGARSRALPAWLGWAGVVIGVLLFFIAAFFVPLVLLVLWVLIAGIVMLRRPARAALAA